MNTFINYLIEANLGLVFFILIYWLFLEKENQFELKRGYLLSSIVFSLTFPLLHINFTVSKELIPSIGQVVPAYWLPEIIVNGSGLSRDTETVLSVWVLLEWIYLLVGLVFAMLFVFQLISILRLFIRSEIYHWKNCLISESEEDKPTFSFFKFIFIGQANKISQEEKQEILFHELVHAQKFHSLDVVIANLLGILFWFNPIVRIYKKALVQLHEFEADARSVKDKDVDVYCSLLAKVALQSADFTLANHFNNSLILKRISMMKAVKTKVRRWKLATIVPLFIGLFVFVACQDQIQENQNEPLPSSFSNNESMPEVVRARLVELQQIYPTSKFVVIERTAEGNETLKQIWKRKDVGIFQSFSLFEGDSNETMIHRDFVIVELTDRKIRRASLPKNEKEIYTQVDEPASPVLGINQFYERISQVLTYPEESRILGTEGRVFLEFLVETDGSISDVQVIKGIDEYLDAEAIRVLLQVGGTWDPAIHHGKVVRQKIALPIYFSLKDLRKTTD